MITDTEKQNIVKSILNVRCREGSTIADIEDDYEELTGDRLWDAQTYLNTIDSVYPAAHPNGQIKWYVKSDNAQHITKMILEQKGTQQQLYQFPQQFQLQQQNQLLHRHPKPQHVLNDSINSNDCFFKDNVIYKLRKMNTKFQQLIGIEDENNHNGSCYNLNLIATPSLSPSPPQPKKRTPIQLDAQFVGDDLFRSLATRDTIDHQIINRKNGIQQIGFCVSGQTIASAAKQIELAHYFKAPHLILNVGSVDILNGRSIDDMCTDFGHLIRVCEQRGCVPIVTTLAPLADNHRSSIDHDKLTAFNFHLLHKYNANYPFIDIWQQFAMRNGVICKDFYETDVMHVIECNQTPAMWSTVCRSLIRNHILKQLRSILKISKTERINIGA